MNAIDRPVRFGSVEIESPLILAPMAGVCDLPYRMIARKHGAALVCAEMVSAKGLVYGNKHTREMLTVHKTNILCQCSFLGRSRKLWPERLRLHKSTAPIS